MFKIAKSRRDTDVYFGLKEGRGTVELEGRDDRGNPLFTLLRITKGGFINLSNLIPDFSGMRLGVKGIPYIFTGVVADDVSIEGKQIRCKNVFMTQRRAHELGLALLQASAILEKNSENL